VRLYQRTATHLSVVRSSAPDPAVVAWLSAVVARARGAVAGGHEPLGRELSRFVAVSFPAAVYRVRWWVAGAAAGSAVLALAMAVWVARSPAVQAAVGSPAEIRQLVQNDFENYYSENAASGFAAQVWTNNAWIAAICFILGITGIGVVYILVTNALNVGLIGGLMAVNGRLDLFFGLITPHGLLELTAVFVAGGSGLTLFWAWVDPGPRPRSEAVAEQGRSMVTVALGLIGVLLVSGVIEAFVTPSGLPTWARIGIGVVAWLSFLTYVGVLGRRAVRAGEIGDLEAGLNSELRPVSG
jgi:uncharacterized membrane protein SpoIIM required for sporulation